MKLRGKGDTYSYCINNRLDGIFDRGKVIREKKIMTGHFVIEGVDERCKRVDELNSCKLGKFYVAYGGEVRCTGCSVAIIVLCSCVVCWALPGRFEFKASTRSSRLLISSTRSYRPHIRHCETAGARSLDCA